MHGPAILETDSALALKAFSEQASDRSPCWTIIREIKDIFDLLNEVRVEKSPETVTVWHIA
jgi:hypothetical protein